MFHQVLDGTHSIGQLNAYGAMAYQGPVLTTGAWGQHVATMHKDGAQHFVLPTEGDGRLWHTLETSSGWDTNLITAGATLDAPASIVHLPTTIPWRWCTPPEGDAAIHVAWAAELLVARGT
ncbi:MAG: hypothetical protein CM15mP128_2740 [Methanobacteriota archaeon]|nr:MAG: hypothetical protein CM15mP128_2740 [Euryarchaeota archaeon]